MAAMNAESHCMSYKAEFEHADLESTKLKQSFTNDTTKTKYAKVFTGKYGIEALLFCEERFRKIARQFDYEDEELFDNWEDCLQDRAEDDWTTVVDGVAPRNTANFNATMQDFYLKYCAEDAKDTMYEYLKTMCRKPVGAEPRDHVNRLLTLYRYTSKLPGNVPTIQEDQQKLLIFHTFPEKWRKQFVRSGRRLQQETLQQIIDFMTNEKGFADDEAKEAKNKRKSDDSNNNNSRNKRQNNSSGSNQRNQNGGNQHRIQPTDICPIHGGHQWKECSMNPQSSNYRARTFYRGGGRGYDGNGGRNGGRQGGRFGGRGRGFQGRFNPGRGHYHQQHQANQNGNQQQNQYHFGQGQGGPPLQQNGGLADRFGGQHQAQGAHHGIAQQPLDLHHFDAMGPASFDTAGW